MIDFDRLQQYAAAMGQSLSEKQLHQFDVYAEFLTEYNEKVNLTAITDPEGIVAKHFADCLVFTRQLKGDESVIDVGTGAGFPGVVAKIVCPEIQLTLLDSLDKRITFLNLLAEKLELPITCIHGRAEEAGRGELREQFDIATARAVANLSMLSEFCMPFVKVGGRFIAMKGPDGENEAKEAKQALSTLGAGKTLCEKTALDGVGDRTLIICNKARPTPKQYPRQFAKIKKMPL